MSKNPFKSKKTKPMQKQKPVEAILPKPRNKSQQDALTCLQNSNLVFLSGPPGSGKTALAVRYASYALITRQFKKIIIARPTVTADEEIGFLPGLLSEKLLPFLIPLYDEFKAYFDKALLKKLMDEEYIEIVPLCFMRGRNFHDSIVVLDEMQNATYSQIKMALTRIGNNSLCVMTADPQQSDLNKKDQGGFEYYAKTLQNIEGVKYVKFKSSDVVRSPIVKRIMEHLDSIEVHDPLDDLENLGKAPKGYTFFNE